MNGAVVFLLGVYQKVFGVILAIPFVGRLVDLFLAVASVGIRPLCGSLCAVKEKDKPPRPEKLLKLYEFEGCPFCRKVREALTELDLDVIVYPCPRETLKAYGVCVESRFRPEVRTLGGKLAFPFLVDENTGTKLYESDQIVKYLFDTYGKGVTPSLPFRIFSNKWLQMPSLFVGAFLRPLPRMGTLRTPSKAPEQPLILWSMEGSPFCKLVREALCTLELPYAVRNVGHGSTRKRQEFRERFSDQIGWRKQAGIGKFPFLEDPNTSVQMSESRDIVEYLFKTYATGPTVNESFSDYSTKGASASHGTIPGASRKQD